MQLLLICLATVDASMSEPPRKKQKLANHSTSPYWSSTTATQPSPSPWKPTKQQLELAKNNTVPDIIVPNLRLNFMCV